MSSLEIAVAQPAFQNHLGTLRAQTPLHGKVISSPFTFGNHKKLFSAWKASDIPRKLNFNLGHIKIPKGGLLIKAVATLESKSLVQNENAHMDYKTSQLDMDSSSWTMKPKTSSEDSGELDEREKLRRMRISKANKGNTPWNKGRKHSPETLQLIKERTRLAMQDPKVKMKLVNLGHAQSQETRKKIGLGVRMGWQRRREMLSVQENCCFEWQNLIAEASRRGYDGEEELLWDSYKIIDKQLKAEWLESVEQRKIMRRPKGSKRAPKSPEQRRKISEAISAKWNDPGYRERVCSALAKYYDASYGAERKPRRRSSGSTESTRKSPAKKKVTEENNFSKIEIKIQSQRQRMRRRKAPSYKDPLANSKMEMIKNIRAQRAAAETKKTEAIERARLLIAEAEKAAMALEVAATKSPIARASLIETRQLIAEAIKSIESIETAQVSSHENEDPLAASNEVISQGEKETCAGIEGLTEADNGKVNGTQSLSPSEDDDFGFDKVTLLDMLNGEEDLPPMSPSGYGLPSFSFENLIKQSDSRDQADQLEQNGNNECTKNLSTVPAEEETSDQLEPNGTKVQSQQEDMADRYEPNGTKVKSLEEETPDQLEPNGTEVQSQQEETPSELVTVTKKWDRGRLIEVAE